MPSQLSAPLTRKQSEVVRLIGQGLDYKQVAAMLCCSVAVVRDHAHAAARKMPKPYLSVKARILDWCRNVV